MEIKDLKVGDEVYFEYWGGWRNIYATNKRLSSIFGLPKAKKKVTNADKIRSMTDESLGKWICSIMSSDCCRLTCPARNMRGLNDNGLVKWLKQSERED